MSKNSKKMKRNRIFKLMVCALLFLVTGVQAQSLKDILNSSAVRDAVTAVTGGKQLSVENLAGTWTYVNPAIQLEGDNALKNVAASVAASEIEKKLNEYCAKVGIEAGAFNYTFNADSTFTSQLKGRTLNGTYSFNAEEKTIELKYGKLSKLNLATMTAYVVLSDDQLSLLFNVDKLLDFLTKLSSLSDNTALQTINKLASEYDGMKLGFELSK